MIAWRAVARVARQVRHAAVWFAFAGGALGGAAVPVGAQDDAALREVVQGRFTVRFAAADDRLAHALAANAEARDSFPGLPRPKARVEIWIAPDDATFSRWVGAGAPEWGNAFAFPLERRIVLHGHRGGQGGDALSVMRHELAHLALHEALGDLPPRWFDEGYASYSAGEWGRDEVLATNFALAIALGRLPTFAGLDSSFWEGATTAQAAYALSYRAVAEMASLDRQRGLTLFFAYWREERSLERALRQAYGMTLGGFEQHWQRVTRRRYGGLALVTDVTAGALLVLLMVGPLWLVRRQRQRKRLEAMRAADAAQSERERASALAALLGEDGQDRPH